MTFDIEYQHRLYNVECMVSNTSRIVYDIEYILSSVEQLMSSNVSYRTSNS